MRKKPIVFNFLFFFFSVVAISMPLQVAVLYEHTLFDFNEWQSIFIKLTSLNWIVLAFCVLNGVLCFKASSLIKYTIPAGIILVGINNFFVGSYGNDYAFIHTWIATLLYALFSYSFVYAHGLEIINNPSRHWWKIPKRIQRTYPIWIEINNEKKLLAKTFDLSKSGAFISTITNEIGTLSRELKVGDEVKIFLQPQGDEICIDAKLVRKEEDARGHYPSGFGLHFKKMNLLSHLRLRSLLTGALTSA